MAIKLLKDIRMTIKELALNACSVTMINSGFSVDDANFFIEKMTEDAKAHRYRDTMYRMSFVQQRSKLKCCLRICRFVMWIDLIFQTHLHKIVLNQIKHFETDVCKHFKYIPSDDLLDDSDVKIILESERSPDDPKVLYVFHNI